MAHTKTDRDGHKYYVAQARDFDDEGNSDGWCSVEIYKQPMRCYVGDAGGNEETERLVTGKNRYDERVWILQRKA